MNLNVSSSFILLSHAAARIATHAIGEKHLRSAAVSPFPSPSSAWGSFPSRPRRSPAAKPTFGLESQYESSVRQQDVATLERLIANDFVATSSRGELRDKATEIADIAPAPGIEVRGFELDDISVRLFGDAAIVTGRAKLDVRIGARASSSVSRYTRIYARREENWRIVGQQLTRIETSNQ
ncbi:nuclear transport factor 2 family protein [Hankyongella ginsenosidimutans]|nr:nuclear transport factor 2 family protein [Hankyongella ginsenosidimutans]